MHAAVGTDDPRDVDAFLAEALRGGPVFVDRYAQWYYVLVPVSTGRRAEWRTRSRRNLGAEFLGIGSVVGVPRPEATHPDSERSYWCVPMDGPGTLADPSLVSRFLTFALRRQAKAAEKPAGASGDVPPLTPGSA
ncbi:hypothetical protein ACWD4G_07410 [Streptomyces sp. NPDC002643]